MQVLQSLPNVEVICVGLDEAPTRAERLNIGFSKAQGSMILFYHPRSSVAPEGIKYLIDHCDKKIWGGFTHQFDVDQSLLRLQTSRSGRRSIRRPAL